MSILIPKIRTVKNQKSILIPKIRTVKNQQSPGSTTKNHRHNSNNRSFTISTLARVASCKQSAGRCPIQIYPFVIWICRKWWSAGESGVCSKSSTEHRGELNYFHVHLASPISSLIIFPHSQLQHLIKIDKVSSLSSSAVSSTSMPRPFSQAAAPYQWYYCRRHAPPSTAIFLAAPLPHHPPQPQRLIHGEANFMVRER